MNNEIRRIARNFYNQNNTIALQLASIIYAVRYGDILTESETKSDMMDVVEMLYFYYPIWVVEELAHIIYGLRDGDDI
jgi:hypothetical protein